MTMSKPLFANSPRHIKNRSANPSVTLELVDDVCAVHNPRSEPEIVERSSVIEDAATLGPVYALGPSGGRAIPTGQVLVRFKAGVKPSDREGDIRGAGYEIDEVLRYAPEAAWLRSRSGDIVEALSGIEKLERLPDVENVEPQMLMAKMSR